MPAAVLQAPIEVPLPVRVVLLGFQGEGAHGIHLEASVRRAVACAGRWLRSGVAGVGGVSRLLSATPTAPSEPVGTHAAHAHASWRARLGSGTHGLVVAAARGGVQHPVRGRACGRHSAGPVRAGRRVLMAAWRAAVQGLGSRVWVTTTPCHQAVVAAASEGSGSHEVLVDVKVRRGVAKLAAVCQAVHAGAHMVAHTPGTHARRRVGTRVHCRAQHTVSTRDRLDACDHRCQPGQSSHRQGLGQRRRLARRRPAA